jgi:hypothetical protein
MSDLYEKLKEQARESKGRWNKIETLISDMKKNAKAGEKVWEDDIIECLELLVLNLRPAADVEAELKSLEASLFSLDKVLGQKDK